VIKAYIVIKIVLTTIEDTRTTISTIVIEIDIVIDIETEIIITTKEVIIIVEIDSIKEAIIIISVIVAYRY
jgi:tetrahydromethanopterin S-methyltransferase subunit B